MFDEANCAVRGLPDLEAADPGPFCGSSCERDALVACPIDFNIIAFFGCLLDRVVSMVVDLFD